MVRHVVRDSIATLFTGFLGWKRVDVKAEWYAEWSYENKYVSNLCPGLKLTCFRIVASPYPPSRYCSIPKVETTYGEICMNLPVAKFPEAAATNPEVPPPVNDTRPDVEIPCTFDLGLPELTDR